jgi:hypothetical protein
VTVLRETPIRSATFGGVSRRRLIVSLIQYANRVLRSSSLNISPSVGIATGA